MYGISYQSKQHIVTAVKAGDNDSTIADGIKYLSNTDVVTALQAGDSL